MAEPSVIDPKFIPQMSPAWQRGYDDFMYGVVENKESDPASRVLYEAGVQSARDDEARDQYFQAIEADEMYR